MTDESHLRKRRLLGLDDRDEELDNTPKFADAETLAKRRIVRVQRGGGNETASSLKGAFIGVGGVSPSAAPALSTKFGFSDNKNGDSGSGGGAGGPFARATGFSFSLNSNRSDKGGEKSDQNSTNKNNDASVADDATAKKSLFGGAFTFNAAVNSFTEAKERMAKENAAKSKEEEEKSVEPPPQKIARADAFANAAPVTSLSEDVLASIPCKLFVFKAETKNWSECGTGEAKVKRHESKKKGDTGEENKYLYRLIVRDGYALNASLNSNFSLTKAEDTHVIFSIPKDSGIATYLVKYAGQQVAERGAEFTKSLKDALKLSQ